MSAPQPPIGPRRLLIRPGREDLRLIGLYVGKVLVGLGLVQLIPLAFAVLIGAWNDVTAMSIGAATTLLAGLAAEWKLHTRKALAWSHGVVTVASAWLIGPIFLAIPLYLSGHFGSFVDAAFDAMSGLTTSGLTLLQDLDHLSPPMNLLRHLSQFIGGQGIIVVVLTVFATSGGAGTLYVGEARDDRIVPNIVRTARFIFSVALTYFAIGTVALWLAGTAAGLAPGRALFHAVNLFMAGFDTGGFAPNSTSIGYYHSPLIEGVVVVLMIAGALSFGLHYELWRGRRREIMENLETRTLAVTLLLTGILCLLGLGRAGALDGPGAYLRKGAFTIVSAHTGTGFGVTNPRLFSTEWGLIAPAAVVIAMALGGMASSTAGGFKALRVGLAAKSTMRDIRRVLAPDAALVVATYQSRGRRILRDREVRAALTVVVLFLVTYVAGAAVGVYFGFPFDVALFESTSAAANVGLSAGVLDPTNPLVLKLTYMAQMYLGRLEFMTVFALIGYVLALARGRH